MDKFLARSGKIHFLFADQGPYYLESLIIYGLDDYLGYQLRRNGFKRLYYINTGSTPDGKWLVQMYDSTSAQAFLPFINKGGFLKFNKSDSIELQYNNEEHRKSVTAIHGSKETLRNTLLAIYNNTDSAAFIFSCPCFYQIFNSSEYRETLKKALGNPNNNLFVLSFSRDSAIWLPSMKDKTGVFQSDLFPELSDLNKIDADLYKYLEDRLDTRFHIWKDRTEENIKRMLKREILAMDAGSFFPISHLDIYARIIYLLTVSEEFRNDYSYLLPYRSGMTFENTILYCMEPTNVSKIENLITRTEEKGFNAMDFLDKRRYFKDRKTGFYSLETGVAADYRKLPVKQIQPLLAHNEASGFEDFIFDAASVLDSPRTCPDQKDVSDAMEYALSELKKIATDQKADEHHVSDVFSLIRYALFDKERERNSALFEKKLGYRKACAELSRSAFEAKEKLEPSYQSLEELRKKMTALIESLEKRPNWENIYAVIKRIPKMGEANLESLTPMLNDKEIRELVNLGQEKRNLELICQGLSSRAEAANQNRTRIMLVLDKFSTTASDLEIGGLLREISEIIQGSYGKVKEEAQKVIEAGSEIDQMIESGDNNKAIRQMGKSIIALLG